MAFDFALIDAEGESRDDYGVDRMIVDGAGMIDRTVSSEGLRLLVSPITEICGLRQTTVIRQPDPRDPVTAIQW